jgi:NADP-dependent 3-hydroxy acid dehydrogenase YdfG
MVRQALERSREQIGDVLRAEDVADAIRYTVTRPPHVSLNELVVRPRKQAR